MCRVQRAGNEVLPRSIILLGSGTREQPIQDPIQYSGHKSLKKRGVRLGQLKISALSVRFVDKILYPVVPTAIASNAVSEGEIPGFGKCNQSNAGPSEIICGTHHQTQNIITFSVLPRVLNMLLQYFCCSQILHCLLLFGRSSLVV